MPQSPNFGQIFVKSARYYDLRHRFTAECFQIYSILKIQYLNIYSTWRVQTALKLKLHGCTFKKYHCLRAICSTFFKIRVRSDTNKRLYFGLFTKAIAKLVGAKSKKKCSKHQKFRQSYTYF